MAKLFTKSITFRISDHLYQLLCERAIKEQRTLSSLIVHILTQALEKKR